MQSNRKSDLWMSRLGFGLIFFYCFLASIFYSNFAELYLTLSFFPVPIFVGEIILFICSLLLVMILTKDKRFFTARTMLLLGIYFGFVGVKALINYSCDGPLTFRNAALFYYPIFSVFTYCFYQKAKLSRNLLKLLVVLVAVILFFKVMVVYYWWTYVMLFIIVLWNTRSIRLRWIGWIFLGGIFLLGSEYLFKGPRAHFVSVFGSVLFLLLYFVAVLLQRNHLVYLSVLVIGFLLFTSGFFIFSDRNDISSVTSLKRIVAAYKETDKIYKQRECSFVPKTLSVHLYNPNDPKPRPFISSLITELQTPFTLTFPSKTPVSAEETVPINPVSTETVQENLVFTHSVSQSTPSLPSETTLPSKVSVPAEIMPAKPVSAHSVSQSTPSLPSETTLPSKASVPAEIMPAKPVSAHSASQSTSSLSSATLPSKVSVSVSVASMPVKPVFAHSVSLEDCQRNLSLVKQVSVIGKDIFRSRIREGRSLELNETNIVFRLFIWRDMIRELIREKAWWGFSFGKPQRSRSLEVLHWAEGEWGRDGWITPHNSFFHIIYRTGILGICLIGILLFLIGRLVRDFYRMSSIKGGLLIGILVYWLVLANFFVILELPYNAIVIWTFFGFIWAYRDQLISQGKKNEKSK